MSFSIAGKTAVVTGAANGVGLAIARHFVARGANVMFADMDEERLAKEIGAVEDDDEGQEPKNVEKEQEAATELVGDEDLSTDSDISSFKPKVPKFGGITRMGLDAWAVWTGGKPTVSWLELQD